MNRRRFLSTAAGGLAVAHLTTAHTTIDVLAAQPAPTSSSSAPRFRIVDTHTHFYDPSRPEGVPWPGKNDKSLYRPVLPDEYQKLAEPLGISGTVVVEASPWVEDNQWLLDLAAKSPFLWGIVGRLDTAADGFADLVRRFARNPLYRGIRISHNELAAGLNGMIVERCQLLVDHNLELDVNGGPDMPTDVARLAARLPDLRIVINHCANLKIDGSQPPAAWRDAMTAASEHRNVYCKVSALVEQTARKPAPRDVDYYRPVLDTLWERFGEDRLIFGSNWPVSERGAPLATVVGIVRDYFVQKGDAVAAKYFQDNARRAYAWPKR